MNDTLSTRKIDLRVWSPDAVGSICFLVASELALAEVCRRWVCLKGRSLPWRIAALNMVGSVAFGVAAAASLIEPSTNEPVSAGINNVGTALGALCFLVGGVLLLPESAAAERPAPRVAPSEGCARRRRHLGSRTRTAKGERSSVPLHEHRSDDQRISIRPQFARPGELAEVNRFVIGDGSMAPDTAYQIVHDELMLDGNARLNLATFVTTWMEPQAERLMLECADKNMIDKDEYPVTAELEMRCVSMLANLFHAKPGETATGCSTTGSSEAAMLAGLAMKWKWRERRGRPEAGRCTEHRHGRQRPGVLGEVREVLGRRDAARAHGPRDVHDAGRALALCDENTIGVVAILGSTFDGVYEPVKEICDALDQLEKDTGLDIPLHVDGASGAFIAPFIDPDLEWDFRIPRVVSINASGHKFGLVYPASGG